MKKETNTITRILTVRAFPTKQQTEAFNAIMYLNTSVFNAATARMREIDAYVSKNLPEYAYVEVMPIVKKGKKGKKKKKKPAGIQKGEKLMFIKPLDELTEEEQKNLKKIKSELYKQAIVLYPPLSYKTLVSSVVYCSKCQENGDKNPYKFTKDNKEYIKKIPFTCPKCKYTHPANPNIDLPNLLKNNYFITKEYFDKYFHSSSVSSVFEYNLKIQEKKVMELRKMGKSANYNFAKNTDNQSFRTGSKMGDWKIIKDGRHYFLAISKFSNSRNHGLIRIAIDKKYWHEKFGGVTEGKSCTITRNSISNNNSKYLVRLSVNLEDATN